MYVNNVLLTAQFPIGIERAELYSKGSINSIPVIFTGWRKRLECCRIYGYDKTGKPTSSMTFTKRSVLTFSPS